MQTNPSAPEFLELRRRVDKLARSNRLLAGAVLAVLAIGVLVGADRVTSAQDRVQAKRFELVDDAGKTRAELAIDEDGSAGLFIRDANGKSRVTVTHDDDQSALFLWDEEGQIRVGVAQFAHGGGGLALHGPKGKGSAVMYLKGRGSLTFYNTDGKIVERLPEESD